MRRKHNRPDTSALCHIGFDAVLDRRQLEELALYTDLVAVPRGEVLAKADGFVRQFVAVLDGTVDVTDRAGRASVAGPGTHIGAAELLHGRPHPATVVARTDCQLAVIAGYVLMSTFEYPGVASWIDEHRLVTRPAAGLPVAPASRHLVLVD